MRVATEGLVLKPEAFYYYLKGILPSSLPQILKPESIDYPETDGKPMADSDFQRNPLMYLLEGLKAYYEENKEIYVSGDLLIYYEKDNPQASVAPDVFVAFGVNKHDRRIYKTWEECQFHGF
jgi:hypothetical protein